MLIDGKKIAQNILNEVKDEVKKLSFRPVFCDVLVGSDQASAQYVRMKGKQAESTGMQFLRADYPSSIEAKELITEIRRLSALPDMSGLIVQLPLPANLDRQIILDAVDFSVDVDCLSNESSRLFYEGKNRLSFPTAAAIVEILDSLKENLENKKIVVLGKGILVGRPVAFLLQRRGLNVTTINRSTADIVGLMKSADVIISATGSAGIITAEKIKEGCIVIDAGTSESKGGVVGDVDVESVAKVAAFLAPVPGGVGPVTVAMLLKNVLVSAKVRANITLLKQNKKV